MKNHMVSFLNKATGNRVINGLKITAVALSTAMMSLPTHAALQTGNMNIQETVERAINLVVGFVVAGGIINIVLGVRNLAAGVSDEGGGQDQQKISKGKGQLFSGIIMVGGMAVMQVLGITASLAGYFGT